MFIDETWTATNMARTHGRSARGERLRMGFPHGHRKTTTLVAGLRQGATLRTALNGNEFTPPGASQPITNGEQHSTLRLSVN